jgi:hypothetical protein
VAAFPKAKVIAVGRKAQTSLTSLGIVPEATVRHPANGGAKIFAQQLQQFVNG